MSKIIDEINFERLNSLEDKLNYVKKLNKKAEFEQALHFYFILKEKFEQQAYLENIERMMLQKKTMELSKQLKFNEMQSLIYFDALTNIHNRRYLEIQGDK